MRAATAAAYLDISEATFRRAVQPELTPVPLSPAAVAYLREDLDAWLDAKAGRTRASADSNPWHE